MSFSNEYWTESTSKLKVTPFETWFYFFLDVADDRFLATQSGVLYICAREPVCDRVNAY